MNLVTPDKHMDLYFPLQRFLLSPSQCCKIINTFDVMVFVIVYSIICFEFLKMYYLIIIYYYYYLHMAIKINKWKKTKIIFFYGLYIFYYTTRTFRYYYSNIVIL